MIIRLIALIAFILASSLNHAQDSLPNSQNLITPQFLANTYSRVSKLEARLSGKTEKALYRLQKEEQKLKSKLLKIDSTAADQLFSGSPEKYKALIEKIKKVEANAVTGGLSNYIPYLDTLKNSLQFIRETDAGEYASRLDELIRKTGDLEIKIDQAGMIRQFLRERRQYLKEQLERFGLGKELKKLNKEVYYYSQVIKDYKEILSDPKKLEAKTISLLTRIPAIRNFIQKNSILASLFRMPTATPISANLTGLQTRVSVQQMIQSSVVGAAQGPAQFISQQLQTANSQLSGLKNKISFMDLSGNPEPMPDFKPNSQKTKSLKKRLEFGMNLQVGKINRGLPVTGEIALSMGYKLNDEGIIGVASSYKLGLGSGLQNIHFTNQGYGLRSFIDWKIKGAIYISGGYEKNYLPGLRNLSLTTTPDLWQESGLIGFSKKYPLPKKRKGYIQVLFDFLSYRNIPRNQPIVFRTGIIL